MHRSVINLLRALCLEKIKVEMQPETVFQVEVESCLELHLSWFALSFSLIALHIFLLDSDEVVVDIVLAELLRFAHRLDEIEDVLFVSALARAALHTELRFPIYWLNSFCLWEWCCKRLVIKIWKPLVLLFYFVAISCCVDHVTRG